MGQSIREFWSAARGLQRHPLGVLGITAAVIAVFALVVAAGVSKAYWGYWFTRPSPDPRVLTATRVLSVTPVTTQQTPGGTVELVPSGTYPGPGWEAAERARYPIEFDYYLLDRRVLSSLEKSGVITSSLPAMGAEGVKGLLDAVRRSGILVKEEPGYNQFDPVRAAGTVYEFVDQRGERLLLVAIRGAEISNDHLPYYEVLLDVPAGMPPVVISSQRFFFDIAGLEGMEFPLMFSGFTAIGLLIGVPTVGVVLLVRRYSKSSLMARGLCPKCEYDLLGDHAGGCPECGWSRSDTPLHAN